MPAKRRYRRPKELKHPAHPRPRLPTGDRETGRMQEVAFARNAMKALIVESRRELAELWIKHIERQGISAVHARGQAEAAARLHEEPYDILVIDLVLDEGSALAIADFASYRRPDARVVFVTSTAFFSDGSIFHHAANACAYVQADSPPEDLAAIVAHYGGAP